MANQAGSPLNKELYAAGAWDNYMLSHAGSIIGGLELSGLDPKGLNDADFESLSVLLRNILQGLEQELVVTQYYWHFEGAQVQLRNRDNPRSQLLSERRSNFLNNRGLSGSRLHWLLECPPENNLNSAMSVGALKAIFGAPFDKRAREQLRAMFSARGAWILEQDELKRQVREVTDALESLDARLQVLSPQNEMMERAQLWALNRAIVNLNPGYLETALHEAVPSDHWDQLLPDGDIQQVVVDGLDCLKIDGAVPVYARIVTVGGYGDEYVPEGVWGRGNSPPMLQSGNYLIVSRFRPLSALGRGMMLANKKNELYRNQMSLGTMFKGGDVSGEIERKIQDNQHLKDMTQELAEATNTGDRYGYYQSHVVLFDTNPRKLRDSGRKMENALKQNGLHPVWESAGLLSLYPQLLPGYPKKSYRSAEFNTSQAAACSQIFKSSEGVRHWGDKREEALYILESEDGTPFHYTPFVGDKCLVIGVGPTRSGKTFMKNVMAGHFMKFGGLYHAIDVDPGTEPLARFFREDGGIFRLDDVETSRGFNPFVAARNDRDPQFTYHLLSQLRLMLQMNESKEMQELTASEQKALDKAILDVLELPPEKVSLKTLSGVFEHVTELKTKFSRWLRGGMYGGLFDNVEDGIGTLDRRVAAYNLAGVKDTPELAALAMNELFFRVTRLFEDPAYRAMPKFLEMDEAQYVLSIPGAAERAVAKARTWFKHNGGMGFWSQSPKHFMDIPEWETLRSSATTFIFMADQEMDWDSYKRAFKLKDGECEAIANLIPRKQAFIIQREIGISKTVNINAAPEEYVVATSRPHEAIIVNEMLDKYPDVDEAVDHAVKAIFTEDQV